MTRWISTELRQIIADRAKQSCEYCLIAEAHTFYGCEVDHIISFKHGGSSDADNLAYACALCNRAKGSDVGSISASVEFTQVQAFGLRGGFDQPMGGYRVAVTNIGEKERGDE